MDCPAERRKAERAELLAENARLAAVNARLTEALQRIDRVIPAAAHYAGEPVGSDDYLVPYTRAEWDELVAATEQVRSALAAAAKGGRS